MAAVPSNGAPAGDERPPAVHGGRHVLGDSAAAAAALKGDEAFSWQDAWYPLAPVSYLSRSRPATVTVLGRELAVWYHQPSQSWRAFEDRCPHRLAPLSEGRIEPASGNLQCSYHGWQFGAEGRCAAIPQADSPAQAAAACASGRSCVAAFPVREEQGMLWVWMRPGLDAATASLRSPLPLPAELQAPPGGRPRGLLLGDWYQRDLPLSADFLLENLLDPAHVHFAHHGVIGQRGTAGPVALSREGPLSARGGFSLRVAHGPPAGNSQPGARLSSAGDWAGGWSDSGIALGGVRMRAHFVPPGLVWQEFSLPSSSLHFSMLFYVVPVAPGASRFMAAYSTDALPAALRDAVQAGALAPLEPLLHALQFAADLSSHQVVDGDAVHIYRQEQAALRGGGGWRSAYFMPAAADKGVMLLRTWLDKYAGGGPQYCLPAAAPKLSGGTVSGAAPPQPLTCQQVLDRFEQHTRHCPSCRRALGTVRAARQFLQAGTAAGLAAALALALLSPPQGLFTTRPRSLPLALAGAALAVEAAQQALWQLEQQFVFVDYVHPDRK